MAVRSHQGRCIHVDWFSEKTRMPSCEKEGGQDAEAEDHIKNQVESIETILSLVHGKILSKKFEAFKDTIRRKTRAFHSYYYRQRLFERRKRIRFPLDAGTFV